MGSPERLLRRAAAKMALGGAGARRSGWRSCCCALRREREGGRVGERGRDVSGARLQGGRGALACSALRRRGMAATRWMRSAAAPRAARAAWRDTGWSQAGWLGQGGARVGASELGRRGPRWGSGRRPTGPGKRVGKGVPWAGALGLRPVVCPHPLSFFSFS